MSDSNIQLQTTILFGVLALIFLTACTNSDLSAEGQYPFETPTLGAESRDRFERDKREYVYIEDIKPGGGAIAAHGRRLTADVTVTYAAGGIIYEGPIIIYQGFPFYAPQHPHLLSSGQEGIALGLNGMAVGGRRRFKVERALVCSTYRDAGPNAKCNLISRVNLQKEPIVVEATLTESCIPRMLKMWRFQRTHLINRELCRSSTNGPRYEPDAPLWHFY
ncbi:MAG: hypothetical protein AABY94_05200 [Nitrospirota bacterium]